MHPHVLGQFGAGESALNRNAVTRIQVEGHLGQPPIATRTLELGEKLLDR
jgi:hypothetical protein